MPVITSDAILSASLSIFLFLALSGALSLIVVSLRRPTTLPLAIAFGLVGLGLVVVAIAPWNVPTVAGMILAFLGVAVGALGGDPVTRRILDIATRGRVRETADGGIFVRATATGADGADDEADAGSGATAAVLRGGTTIGYLERFAVVLAIVAGYPEAIAVVVAVKGVGRFSELESAEARERFIIGTLSSLLWACVVGALVRLAIW